MAAGSLSRLKKAAEAKKKGAKAAQPEKEAPSPPAKAAPSPPAQKKEAPKPPGKPMAAPIAPIPAPTPKAAPIAPRAAPPPKPKPSMPPAPNLDRKILDAVMDDPRLTDYAQVARVLIAAQRRKGEVEGKVKSVKEIVDEEIKKLIGHE